MKMGHPGTIMRIAFVIYDGMTMLDFVGVFDAVTRLKTMGFIEDLAWDICALTPEVTGTAGLVIKANKIGEPLSGYEVIVVPGGHGYDRLLNHENFLDWLRTGNEARWMTSVCTGSLLLGAAGLLRNKTATTHPTAMEQLKPYCAVVSNARIVDDRTVITARGVTASIDLGLYLCGKLAGPEVKEKIRKQMDYSMPGASPVG